MVNRKQFIQYFINIFCLSVFLSLFDVDNSFPDQKSPYRFLNQDVFSFFQFSVMCIERVGECDFDYSIFFRKAFE